MTGTRRLLVPAIFSLILVASACQAAYVKLPNSNIRYRSLQDDNTDTPAPTPAATATPTAAPTSPPSPSGNATAAPTPSPPPPPGNKTNRAKTAVGVVISLVIAAMLGWAGYTFRFQIATWCRNSWTSFRRYGVKGWLLYLIGRRPDAGGFGGGEGASLNEIIFDPDEQGGDMSRGLLSG